MTRYYKDKNQDVYKQESLDNGKSWWSKKVNGEWFVLSGKPSLPVTLLSLEGLEFVFTDKID